MQLFILLMFFLVANPSNAAIYGVSGDINNGSLVSISGLGFDNKTQAAPIQWEDFESGADGDDISTSPPIGSWAVDPGVKYTSNITRAGSGKSSIHDFTSGDNFRQALTRSGSGWGKLYISFWYRTDYGNLTAYYDDPCRNYKVFRMEGDNGTKSGDQGEGVPLISYEKRASTTSSGLFEEALRADYNTSDGSGTFYAGQHPQSPLAWSHQEWHRVEIYVNVIDGQKDFKLFEDGFDNSPVKTESSWTTTFNPLMGSDNSRFDELHFGIYFARDNGASAYTYMDDIYVDTTEQRVELCTGDTWTTRGTCEIQVPTAWADDSVSITMRTGAFSESDTAYIYVVDANGDANADGYAVTIGESSTPTPINGACGTNHGATLSSLTSGDANNCSAGTVSGFTGTGPWSWTCAGLNDGDNSGTCSASLASTPSGGMRISTGSMRIRQGSMQIGDVQ